MIVTSCRHHWPTNVHSPKMDEVRGLLEEIKADQTTILLRLDQIGNTQADAKTQICDLSSDLGHVKQVREDLVLKLQSVRSSKLSPAGVRLVNTTELLEQILWHLGQTWDPDHDDLGLLDLLFAQRVSKQFKAVIDGSQKLQRALYFVPEEPDGTAPRINPLLDCIFIFDGLEFKYKLGSSVLTNTSDTKYMTRHLSLSKVDIRRVEGGPVGVSIRFRMSNLCDWGLPGHPCNCRHNCRPLLGSWQRMLLSQPPMAVAWEASVYDGRGWARISEVQGELDGREVLGVLFSGSETPDGAPKPELWFGPEGYDQ